MSLENRSELSDTSIRGFTPSAVTGNRFYVLDGLRFIAAIAVLLYHYSIYFDVNHVLLRNVSAFGYLGVHFFFILSGFVIAASAQNRSAIDFALARAARLYPAFWAALVFTVAISILQTPNINIGEILMNATIINDYFSVPNFDGVYWTLQAEIKFYGCIFLLLLTNTFKYTKTWLTLLMMATVYYHLWEQPAKMGWVINPGYASLFIGGVCAFLLSRNRKAFYVYVLFILAALVSIVKSYEQAKDFYPAAEVVDQYIAGFIVAVFYFFFILLVFGKFNIKRYTWLSLSGAISYPLYLIHNRAGKVLIERVSAYVDIYIALFVVTVAVILVALIIHLLVEKRLSKWMLNLGGKFICTTRCWVEAILTKVLRT